ncbi:hypothetical protein Tco_0040095 [Tanacetum coccineum]
MARLWELGTLRSAAFSSSFKKNHCPERSGDLEKAVETIGHNMEWDCLRDHVEIFLGEQLWALDLDKESELKTKGGWTFFGASVLAELRVLCHLVILIIGTSSRTGSRSVLAILPRFRFLFDFLHEDSCTGGIKLVGIFGLETLAVVITEVDLVDNIGRQAPGDTISWLLSWYMLLLVAGHF